jgi:hypothetical protein
VEVKVKLDSFVRYALATIVLLLGAIVLRPIIEPQNARAQPNREYQAVPVTADDARDMVARYAKGGWEPVELSFYGPYGSNVPRGFLLVRK